MDIVMMKREGPLGKFCFKYLKVIFSTLCYTSKFESIASLECFIDIVMQGQ